MKNEYKLCYTLLSFREFLHFFFTQKESILLLQLILDSEVLY